MTKMKSDQIKSIIFKLNDEEYAMPVDYVGSIERMMKTTRVPGTPNFVKGVLNLRGVVTPLIDLRLRFGMTEIEETERTRVIIIEHNDMVVGIIVDAANDVIDIQESSIEPPPETVGSLHNEYLEGVAKYDDRLFIILDVDHILSLGNDGFIQDEKLV